MLTAWVSEVAGRRPSPKSRIVELRARDTVVTAGDEHLAIGQQRRCVIIARGVKVAGGRPDAGRRIVEFRSRNSPVDPVNSGCGEYLAIGQQRRGVIPAPIQRVGGAAGGRPTPARRVVEF